jgi:magnesium-transporting ATPase (P-type)
VPADLRLVRIKGLQTQEGALTGESLPVEKRIDPVAVDAPLGDRTSLAYSGTLITYGQGPGSWSQPARRPRSAGSAGCLRRSSR